MLRPLRIAITSGDADGIGPEVTSKALYKIGAQKNTHFVLWRNGRFPKKDLLRIKKVFKLKTVGSWAEALNNMPSKPKELLDICSTASPGQWVEEAASACFFKHLDAMATAPLSKPSIQQSGLKDIGHTDILKRVSNTKNAFMVFLGDKFNVMLATGHVPISKVEDALTPPKLEEAFRAALSLESMLQKIDKRLANRKIGVLGLNPHAGDQGVIGMNEIEVIAPLIKEFSTRIVPLEGPLVPDSAFTPAQWARYSFYLALYHDQGLIPFKTVHGQNGVHLTWGLPFVRTSVDHGTAFDIAGTGKADPTSMFKAILLAVKLAKNFVKDGMKNET
jgi:4-hydroxythreonine-4-phosphate dehydrogenase